MPERFGPGVLGLIGALAIAACSDEAKKAIAPAQGVDGSPVTVAICDHQERCAATTGRTFASKPACADALLAFNNCEPIRFANTRRELDACVAYVRGLACEAGLFDDPRQLSPCDQLQPLGERTRAAEGQSCAVADCQPGYYCEPTGPGELPLCKALKAVSAPCSYSEQCTSGAYCELSTHQCTLIKAAGAPCAWDDECASSWCDEASLRCRTPLPGRTPCSETDRCEGLLACIAGRCAPYRDLGQPCGSAQECLAGLACSGGRCTAEPSICAVP